MNKRFGILALVIALLATGACNGKGGKTSSGETAKASESAATEAAPIEAKLKLDFKPNEMGKIMIMMYHLIGEGEQELRRTPENFRKDLQALHDNGYYPVALDDVVSGNLGHVPAGKTPFVLTFDDSSQGQFRYLQQNGQLVIDPNCAVGIMESFKKKYKDFPLTATFFVLPAIKPNLRLFAQPEYTKQKLEWLVKNGYEIGNHTWFHANLGKAGDDFAREQIANNSKDVQVFLPGYNVHSLALPYGIHAKNRALEREGEYKGHKYKHNVVLLAAYQPIPSPYDKKFDVYNLERVPSGDSPTGLHALIKKWDKHPETRYISDGDAKVLSVPVSMKDHLNNKWNAKFKVNWVEANTDAAKPQPKA